MVKYAKDLTSQGQQLFAEEFYSLVDFDDLEHDTPWGLPWCFAMDVILRGETIEDMAKNYLADYEIHIVESILPEE